MGTGGYLDWGVTSTGTMYTYPSYPYGSLSSMPMFSYSLSITSGDDNKSKRKKKIILAYCGL